MILLTEFLVFASTFLASVAFMQWQNGKRKGGRRYPPSLPRLPLIGSLPFIRDFDNLPEFFMEKSAELGPVFTLQIGRRFILVLNTLEAIEDAFVKHASSFSGREGVHVEKHICNRDQKGIIAMDYHSKFIRYRKLSLSVLKEFGFGSNSKSENLILTEVEQLIDQVRNMKGKAIDPKMIISKSSSNVLLGMLLGRRWNSEDGFSEILLLVEKGVKLLDPTLEFFPILRFLPTLREKLAELVRLTLRGNELINFETNAVLQDETSDCFVTRYVKKEGPDYDHEQLVFMVRDFITAGLHSTSTLLLWSFVHFANRPDIAERIQKEIDAVVPRDRLPSSDDEPNLPFTKATILEIMRLRTPVPFAIPHLTSHDTEVLGYFIPANTVVFPNITSAHMDTAHWNDPEIFRPERFLDESSQLINTNRIIPFSLGRRSCPGEALGRQQLFLFITGLLQNFSFLPPEGVKSISVKAVHAITESPSPYTIRIIPREFLTRD